MTNNTPTLIEVKGLSYLYGSTYALKDISFKIDSSCITALVGPNGAGKSTLMRCLAGLSQPEGGSIVISDVNVVKHPRDSHKYVSYLSDSFGLYDDLTVEETLEYFAGCNNFNTEESAIRIEEISTLLKLKNKLSQKCSGLSRGWRQRVGIGIALINNPKVLILDEPASGLDPESRSELSFVLKTLHSKGVQIFVSSHILSELEEYCDSMLVLREGKIREHVKLNSLNTEELLQAIITFARPLEQEEITSIQQLLKSECTLSQNQQQITCFVQNDGLKQHEILKALIGLNYPVSGFKIETKSLENLYLDTAAKD